VFGSQPSDVVAVQEHLQCVLCGGVTGEAAPARRTLAAHQIRRGAVEWIAICWQHHPRTGRRRRGRCRRKVHVGDEFVHPDCANVETKTKPAIVREQPGFPVLALVAPVTFLDTPRTLGTSLGAPLTLGTSLGAPPTLGTFLGAPPTLGTFLGAVPTLGTFAAPLARDSLHGTFAPHCLLVPGTPLGTVVPRPFPIPGTLLGTLTPTPLVRGDTGAWGLAIDKLHFHEPDIHRHAIVHGLGADSTLDERRARQSAGR